MVDVMYRGGGIHGELWSARLWSRRFGPSGSKFPGQGVRGAMPLEADDIMTFPTVHTTSLFAPSSIRRGQTGAAGGNSAGSDLEAGMIGRMEG